MHRGRGRLTSTNGVQLLQSTEELAGVITTPRALIGQWVSRSSLPLLARGYAWIVYARDYAFHIAVQHFWSQPARHDPMCRFELLSLLLNFRSNRSSSRRKRLRRERRRSDNTPPRPCSTKYSSRSPDTRRHSSMPNPVLRT